MMKYSLLMPISLGAIGSIFPTTIAQAITFTNLDSDQAMNALSPKISFVAEGRIGDSSGQSTYELDLHAEDPGFPQVTDQFNWLNGQTENFELTYDAESNFVNYLIGTQTLSFDYTEPFSDIFLRTRAVDMGASIVVDNLVLDDQTLNASSSAIGEVKGLDILRISDFEKSFRLAGNVTMSWTDETPRNSRLAYQIKVGTPTTEPVDNKKRKIPEPGAIAGLFTVGLLSIASRKLKVNHT